MNKKQERFAKQVVIKNRKAAHEFALTDQYSVGLVLKGSEIKSLREGKASLQESYCYFRNGELFIKQMNIKPYTNAGYINHEAQRDRKLLLTKSELKKIQSKSEEKGMSIVPVRLYINDRGLAKLDIALGKGKKLFDKRQDLKKKDLKREIRETQI
jgi:SsrA-binding protein